MTNVQTVRSSRGLLMELPRDAEGPIITRTFRAKRPELAATDAAEYLAHIGPLGWTETSRMWTEGRWGCGAFILALLAFLILVGILIFIYLLMVKPDGALVVTYSKTTNDVTEPR